MYTYDNEYVKPDVVRDSGTPCTPGWGPLTGSVAVRSFLSSSPAPSSLLVAGLGDQ